MFMPESAYGPTNQCIGLGKVLLDRGHRVVFAAEASWAGRLEPFGFVEALVDLAEPDPDAAEGAAGQFWIDFVNETAPEFAKPTRDQLASFVQPTYAALVAGARYAEPRLRQIIAEHRPDVVVEDNVVALPGPSDRRRGVRAHRVVQPARSPRRRHPADLLRLPDGRPLGVGDFLEEYDRMHADTWRRGTRGARSRAPRPCPAREFMHASPDAQPLRLSRASSTTPAPAPSTTPGTASTPASARPTRTTRSRASSPTVRTAVALSTCRSVRSAEPTSTSCSGSSTCSADAPSGGRQHGAARRRAHDCPPT